MYRRPMGRWVGWPSLLPQTYLWVHIERFLPCGWVRANDGVDVRYGFAADDGVAGLGVGGLFVA